MGRKRPAGAPNPSELNNQDIFLYALYRLGGAGQYVNVEEVVQECWRLSPTRFGWKKLEYPSDRTGWAAVGHIENGRGDLMMKTPNGLGRQLSAEGVEWIRSRLPSFERLAAKETRAPKTRRPSFKVVAEASQHPWAAAYLAGDRNRQLGRLEAAVLLKCAPDSPRDVWRQRMATLRSAAADNERTDIIELLEYIEQSHPEWFAEGAA